MTNKQPEALRLATVLENKLGGADDDDIESAAAELRRLHDAYTAARDVCLELMRTLDRRDVFIAELEAHNAELLAALRGLLADTQHAEHDCGDKLYCPVVAARAAIAHAEGQA